MDAYNQAAAGSARAVIAAFSTSFGTASRLLPRSYRQHIYNIYGLVRVADEIVDTYSGSDRAALLQELQAETHATLRRGFSTNIVVQAFATTARQYGIGPELIDPFYASMRMDLSPQHYTPERYKQYIYGSAEVVGLMCLKVFCLGDDAIYRQLEAGARVLGAAFQKVNFLRDLQADYQERGRYYFPVGSYKQFDDATKQAIIADISADLATAKPALQRLPNGSRLAVCVACRYYEKLLQVLEYTPATTIQTRRIRLHTFTKLRLLVATYTKERLGS